MKFREISLLFQHELKMGFGHRSALPGLVLYILSSLMVGVLIYNSLSDSGHWIILFWLLLIFFITYASALREGQEGRSGLELWQTLVSAASYILVRMIFNSLLMALLGFFSFGLFVFVFGAPLLHWPVFLITLGLGSVGFAALFTFVSSLASGSGKGFALTALLGFPLSVPLIILCTDLTSYCLDLQAGPIPLTGLLLLLLSDIIVFSLAALLFPFIWKS